MKQDILTIDPLQMGIVNRVAAQSRCEGRFVSEGGLLVQGFLDGDVTVKGPLVVWEGAQVCGKITLLGDLYLFGTLGQADPQPMSEVTCFGTAFLANSAISYATLCAQRIQMYDGAQLQGPFKTLQNHQQLPQLQPDSD